jgi:hypothetical protein
MEIMTKKDNNFSNLLDISFIFECLQILYQKKKKRSKTQSKQQIICQCIHKFLIE